MKSTYKRLTNKELKEALKAIMDQKPSKREFTMVTGFKGKWLWDRAMLRAILSPQIDELLENNLITTEQKANLNSMLDSPDDENYNLAHMIIKTKYDGIKI